MRFILYVNEKQGYVFDNLTEARMQQLFLKDVKGVDTNLLYMCGEDLPVGRFNHGNGCEYCSELFTGEMNEMIMTIPMPITVCGIEAEKINMNLYIDNDNLEVFIDNNRSNLIKKQNVKIKYCPFCGRELKKEVIK